MSRRGPGVAIATTALLVLVVASFAGSGAHDSAFVDVGQIEPDTVLLDVSLRANGDAAWSIRYRVRLDDENATAAFESLEQDVRENESAFANRFEERISGTVATAENATGREMAVRNVSVRTTRQEIPQEYGVLIYEFEWTNFAVVDGPTIRAGDAIGGLFLDESTSLTIRWPEGYGLASVDPSPDDTGSRSATWRGRQDFSADQPRVVVSTEAADGGTGATLPAVVGLLALVVVVAAGWWWRSRRRGVPGPAGGTTDAEPPDELLSNQERVLQLLEAHGGRMKQQQVVEELDWTDAKTSQVVGDLRESGEIEVFRLGRENVLNLPAEEEEPEDR